MKVAPRAGLEPAAIRLTVEGFVVSGVCRGPVACPPVQNISYFYRGRSDTTQGGITLTELPAAVLTFVCLTAAALAGLFGGAIHRSPTQDDINTTVRLVANIFVVMTSLVLGLMLNSAKNTFETDNRNVHALATDLILLDRTMKDLGPQANEARRHLTEYVQTSLTEASILEEDSKAETLLNAVGASLRAIQVSNDQQVSLWNDARLLYRQIVGQRWVVIDQSGGTIPTPLIVMLDRLARGYIRQLWLPGPAQSRRSKFIRDSSVAHFRCALSDRRYGFTGHWPDQDLERAISASAGPIPALSGERMTDSVDKLTAA